MDTMAPVAETFSAAVATPLAREDATPTMEGTTRCGSGMGGSRDD